MRRLIALLLLLAPLACTTTVSQLEPDVVLTTVQRPSDVAERWGAYTLTEADTAGYSYQDDLVSLTVVAAGGVFTMVVENRSEHSMRILWPEMSYVGPDGFSSGVVPGETRWIEMNQAPAPQAVPAASRASLLAIPLENANTSARRIDPFFPLSATCSDVVGSEFRLIVPLEIQGSPNEYTLRFEVPGAARVTYLRDAMAGTSREESREPC